MCCFYRISNTINLVTATKYTAFWIMEYCVFVKDLVDCSASTHGVIFRQIRPSDYEAARSICCRTWLVSSRHQIVEEGNRPSLSRCMHRRKVAARRGVLIVQIIDCRNQAIRLTILGQRVGNDSVGDSSRPRIRGMRPSTVHSRCQMRHTLECFERDDSSSGTGAYVNASAIKNG